MIFNIKKNWYSKIIRFLHREIFLYTDKIIYDLGAFSKKKNYKQAVNFTLFKVPFILFLCHILFYFTYLIKLGNYIENKTLLWHSTKLSVYICHNLKRDTIYTSLIFKIKVYNFFLLSGFDIVKKFWKVLMVVRDNNSYSPHSSKNVNGFILARLQVEVLGESSVFSL